MALSPFKNSSLGHPSSHYDNNNLFIILMIINKIIC